MILHSPFTVGRAPDRDLVLSHPFVSRKHAEIIYDAGAFFISDVGSRHGTFVNGQRIERQRLTANDAIHFGSIDGPVLRFDAQGNTSHSTIRDLLGQIQAISSPNSDLEKLRWFLEAARKLNTVGAVDQILASLVETTLQLTKVERGYVFLVDEAGVLNMAVGRSSSGEVLADDQTLSRTAIQQATRTAGEYMITDTLTAESGARTDSMVAQSIRTVICIPLRRRREQRQPGDSDGVTSGEILGVLYLDSRLNPGKLTEVDNDLLKTIATEAAALIDNAQLAIAEEHARRYREELNIAAAIQQNLMTVKIPALPYATIAARSIPCKEIGGDFFDVVADDESLSLVLADVSGKGVSAAILASTLQGMVYSQLLAGQPLQSIAEVANHYICAKDVGKYATMVILKLTRNGVLDYINCGHIHPLLCSPSGVHHLKTSNLPVGLIGEATFRGDSVRIEAGSRILLVTDGVTEAENTAGEFFGDERLEEAAVCSNSLEAIFERVQHFCGLAPANDDCTMLEVQFHSERPSALPLRTQ
ncbi:SpoIIE family protein phosphatase [Acidisarcina polymorpha]|uniref:SpoIIE family protein phosphatase n=1 Tax=Acidisarcina polymorpha TaxID=2211140 RepID=UPI001374D7E6|nr:SpoIIE family protein phosphatase [Acidisarcina polymorpha]